MEDVIVLGAGPAGNGTALELARAGFNVTVIDCLETVGDKLCTGIVSVECLREFPTTLPVVYKTTSSATVVSPSGRRIWLEKEAPQAHVIDRVSYVADIAHQAQEAGATYLLGRSATDIRRSTDSVIVKLEGPLQPEQVRAKIVVIATGFGSAFTRQLGLGRIEDFVMGAQMEVLAPAVDEIEVYVGEAVAPGFFAWLVPRERGKALLGLLSRTRSGQRLRHLASALEKRGTIAALAGKTRRWGVPLMSLPSTVGDRVVVVGDAAGQVKPTTGGGIYYALRSSRIAAHAIERALKANVFSAEALAPYEEQWRGLLAEELEAGRRIRGLAEKLNDWQLEQLMRVVASNGFLRGLLTSSDISFDWHGRLAQRVLGFPSLVSSLRPLGFSDIWRRMKGVGRASSNGAAPSAASNGGHGPGQPSPDIAAKPDLPF